MAQSSDDSTREKEESGRAGTPASDPKEEIELDCRGK